jgi:DnaK suppressor protein
VQELKMTNTPSRRAQLKRLLNAHRREIQKEIQERIRKGRTRRTGEVRDEGEHSDADLQGGVELALIQMRADTLTRIEAALVRLAADKYGSCFECAGPIAERRLRALPFAVRCQACEGKRELEQGHARKLERRRGSLSLFPEVVSS